MEIIWIEGRLVLEFRVIWYSAELDVVADIIINLAPRRRYELFVWSGHNRLCVLFLCDGLGWLLTCKQLAGASPNINIVLTETTSALEQINKYML